MKNGGRFVLLGNDKGNSEFEHFNMLTNRFGINFTEDLLIDVVNNQYDSGRITQFSSHPMFKNVHYAFIKQLGLLIFSSRSVTIITSR